MPRKNLIGVDLHGTLLDAGWKIDEKLAQKISDIFLSLNDRFRIFICSGNDLEFVKKHVSKKILEAVEGLVLETGCVYSDKTSEKVILSEEIIFSVKELQKELKKADLGSIKYFARRLATVSIFTDDGTSGEPPEKLFEKVKVFLSDKKITGFYATHSDVAVDIVPSGEDKYLGLRKIDKDASIFSIADSLNDLPLLVEADYSFAPSNLSKKIFSRLAGKKEILTLKKGVPLEKGKLYLSEKSHGEGCADILEFISGEVK
ncbi:hypothetical protein JW890_06385 [candidate division WOR-3 bacterium]|nr:hypothetical protein [candidate division WOR-3 bacterium]